MAIFKKIREFLISQIVQNENTLLLWSQDTGQKVTIKTYKVFLIAKEMLWNQQPRKLILIVLKYIDSSVA